VVYGVYLIKDLELTMGGLIASVILTSRAITPFSQIANLLSSYEHTKSSFLALDKIMNYNVEVNNKKTYVQKDKFNRDIEFKNVSFTYLNDNSREVLKDITFKIKPKEKVAIIGKVGSGKSTINKLLLALFEPSSGQVLIDGIDIMQINPTLLRKNISYVPQNITLLSGSLKDNIVYKYPQASSKKLLEASRISGVLNFANLHPSGFDMHIAERGDNLSGGQKQSVAIARAILLSSDLLIFDEPTNAMDFTTEKEIKQNLKEYIKDKTFILTTHKNSMLELVDRVIVIDNGKITYDGKKENLPARVPEYNNSLVKFSLFKSLYTSIGEIYKPKLSK
jgi:ATP-binding cassette subfamily C protein LapB